jgi:hypothetical protein
MSSSNLGRWGAWAGTLGGLLWALFPLGELPEADAVLTPRGVLVYYGLGYLLPQLLLLMGLARLHTLCRRSYGLLGTVGFFVSSAALMLTFVGGAWEMTNITSTGTVSTAGYWTSIMGFFVLACGSGLLGLAIIGVLRDPPSYLGGLLLAIAEPLGFLFVFAVGGAWDFGSRVGLTVPCGVAWALLGYALLSQRGAALDRRARTS